MAHAARRRDSLFQYRERPIEHTTSSGQIDPRLEYEMLQRPDPGKQEPGLGGSMVDPTIDFLPIGKMAKIFESMGVKSLPAIAGIFAGKNARTANLPALGAAKAMERQGATREEIWKQTGWFKDEMDKNWKFEISDEASKWLGAHQDLPMSGRAAAAIEHKKLFEAYPDLANANLDYIPKQSGSWHTTAKGEDFITIGGAAKNQRSSVLHELQHAVQTKEGFALGWSKETVTKPAQYKLLREFGNVADELSTLQEKLLSGKAGKPDDYRKMLTRANSLQDELDNLGARIDKVADPVFSYNMYRKLAGEIEARNVELRRFSGEALRKEIPPWITQDTPANRAIPRFSKQTSKTMSEPKPIPPIEPLVPLEVFSKMSPKEKSQYLAEMAKKFIDPKTGKFKE